MEEREGNFGKTRLRGEAWCGEERRGEARRGPGRQAGGRSIAPVPAVTPLPVTHRHSPLITLQESECFLPAEGDLPRHQHDAGN
ncbi:hypothetical protein E2C01_062431 [Portunus trituberculatus]|uniref:Uncharacterized protein n=1 Tax=Portunus trituberculatus TaxID=210409 RepID=A0A5B7HDM6_PORTR|nr:hypothetical protein [Portunus trituberculatus]